MMKVMPQLDSQEREKRALKAVLKLRGVVFRDSAQTVDSNVQKKRQLLIWLMTTCDDERRRRRRQCDTIFAKTFRIFKIVKFSLKMGHSRPLF